MKKGIVVIASIFVKIINELGYFLLILKPLGQTLKTKNILYPS